MITDAEQVEQRPIEPLVTHNSSVGQMCLNDDVVTQDEGDLEQLRRSMSRLFEGLLPEKNTFEI
jgi:hypothetical protein